MFQVAMQLIGDYSHRKRNPAEKEPENVQGDPFEHEYVLQSGVRPKCCQQCKREKNLTPSGRVRETNYACKQCGIHLHR